jgi:GTP cyclohydrolase II
MMSGRTKASLLGERAQILVERALSEFRSGRPVLITSASDAITALPVDGMTEAMLVAFRLLSRPVRPFLVVTARRACAIGVEASGPTGIALPDFCGAGEIFSLASASQVSCQFEFVPAGASAGAAIQLAKHAQRLPALLIGAGNTAAVRTCEPPLVAVPAEAVEIDYKFFAEQKKAQQTRIEQERRAGVIHQLLSEANKQGEPSNVEGTLAKETAPAK